MALLLNWIQEREETHEKKGILNLLEIASLERSLKVVYGRHVHFQIDLSILQCRKPARMNYLKLDLV